MSSVTAPADRRFRRAHVKPGRRKRHWLARLRTLLVYAAVILSSLIIGKWSGPSAV